MFTRQAAATAVSHDLPYTESDKEPLVDEIDGFPPAEEMEEQPDDGVDMVFFESYSYGDEMEEDMVEVGEEFDSDFDKDPEENSGEGSPLVSEDDSDEDSVMSEVPEPAPLPMCDRARLHDLKDLPVDLKDPRMAYLLEQETYGTDFFGKAAMKIESWAAFVKEV